MEQFIYYTSQLAPFILVILIPTAIFIELVDTEIEYWKWSRGIRLGKERDNEGSKKI